MIPAGGQAQSIQDNLSPSFDAAIKMIDRINGLEATLFHSIFPECDVLVRSMLVKNTGSDIIRIDQACSLATDLPASHYEMYQLTQDAIEGSRRSRSFLPEGPSYIQSRVGITERQHNPFVGLVSGPECYGFSLSFPGPWLMSIHNRTDSSLRTGIGLNTQSASWILSPLDVWSTPEAMMSRTSQGVARLASNFHHLFLHHLGRQAWRDSYAAARPEALQMYRLNSGFSK